jgi:hypothetical protein
MITSAAPLGTDVLRQRKLAHEMAATLRFCGFPYTLYQANARVVYKVE